MNLKGKVAQAAVAGGIVWGGCVFLTTIVSVYTGYGVSFLNFVASIYPGYDISLVGSVVGLIYGFFDVFVGVYIINWVYRQVGKFT